MLGPYNNKSEAQVENSGTWTVSDAGLSLSNEAIQSWRSETEWDHSVPPYRESVELAGVLRLSYKCCCKSSH